MGDVSLGDETSLQSRIARQNGQNVLSDFIIHV